MTARPMLDPQAHAELLNLEGRYAMCWDRADAEGWAGVFAPEGVFEIAPVGDRDRVVVRGRDALVGFCREFNGRFIGVHVPSLPYFEIDGDSATGHLNVYYSAIGRLGGAHTMSRTAVAHYEVRYSRVSGAWLMQHRLEKATVSARSEYFDY